MVAILVVAILFVAVIAVLHFRRRAQHDLGREEQRAPEHAGIADRSSTLAQGPAPGRSASGEASIAELPPQEVPVRVIVQERIVYRDADPPPPQVIVQERVVYRDPPSPTYEGPPQWVFNVDYKQFVAALAKVLRALLPEGQYDRQRLASAADVSASTVEKLLDGSNPQLLTLWKVCNARQIRLSKVFFDVEVSLGHSKRVRLP